MQNSWGYLSAENVDLELFYQYFFVFYSILNLSQIIQNRKRLRNLIRIEKVVTLLTFITLFECLFGSIYWFEMNEYLQKFEHWTFALVMFSEIARATIARTAMLYYSLGFTQPVSEFNCQDKVFNLCIFFMISKTVCLILEHNQFSGIS